MFMFLTRNVKPAEFKGALGPLHQTLRMWCQSDKLAAVHGHWHHQLLFCVFEKPNKLHMQNVSHCVSE